MLHNAYSFSLAFKETLVEDLLERFSDSKSTIIDPFCGTGTTLLESKIAGLNSVGIDANPICVDVSRAKTEWRLNIRRTERLAGTVISLASREYESFLSRREHSRLSNQRHMIQNDPIFQRSCVGRYLITSGLITRGWISPLPAVKTLLLAEELWKIPKRERDFLFLCLFGILVPDISNMSYGPEIYKKRTRRDRKVFALFSARVCENLKKLQLLRSSCVDVPTKVIWGDSTSSGIGSLKNSSVDLAISSPPYLSDHDYSRITRLELVFSGYVSSKDDLRGIKKRLLRSSSKNVYKGDRLARVVHRFGDIQTIVKLIEERAAGRSSGFARVYPKLIGEYFGGMYQHFKVVARVMRPGGYLAYVIGDQSSFFSTPIPTARIISQLADGCGQGLQIECMEPLKKLRGTRGAVNWSNQEWLLIVKKGTKGIFN